MDVFYSLWSDTTFFFSHFCAHLNDFVTYSSELVSLKLVRMLGHDDSGVKNVLNLLYEGSKILCGGTVKN